MRGFYVVKNPFDKPSLSINEGFSTIEGSTIEGFQCTWFSQILKSLLPHIAVLKTGASGMIAYRLQSKDQNWQWLQTSSRLVYKNSKPDFIISTHRPLM